MKKEILVIALILLAFSSHAQYKYSGCCFELKNGSSNEKGLIWENDSVKFTIDPTDYFWGITIENKLKIKQTVLWDDCVFAVNGKSSAIVFDNTIKLMIDNPKGESIIIPETSIKKKIYPAEKCRIATNPVYYKSDLKNTGPSNVKLMIATKAGDDNKEYSFDVKISICQK
jgi:hypothetical protein